MRTIRTALSGILCAALACNSLAAEAQVGYGVSYAGGSLPTVKTGAGLKLYIDGAQVRFLKSGQEVAAIPAKSITEVTYGQEVHHRYGTAAAVAVVSLGIGAIVAFSKSKKHYIGVSWTDPSGDGGLVFQAGKNEYRGILLALESVSGKKVGDKPGAQSAAALSPATDLPAPPAPIPDPPAPPAPPVAASSFMPAAPVPAVAPPVAPPGPPPDPPVTSTAASPAPPIAPTVIAAPTQPVPPVTPPSATDPAKILVRFTSDPASAEVSIDGEYWGSTPTMEILMQPGPHTIAVKKRGFQRWERKIIVSPGDTRTVNAELEPETKDPNRPKITGLDSSSEVK